MLAFSSANSASRLFFWGLLPTAGATLRSSLFARPCGLTAWVCGCAALLHIARPLNSCFQAYLSASAIGRFT